MKVLFAIHNNEARAVDESAGRIELMNPMLQSGLISDHRVLDFDVKSENSLQQIENRLAELEKMISSEPVVICGAGVHTENLLDQFRRFNISALADKDKRLHGNQRYGFPIIAHNEIPEYASHVIISSKAWETAIAHDLEQKLQGKAQIHTLYEGQTQRQFNRDIEKKVIHHAATEFQPDLLVYSQAFPEDRIDAEFFLNLKGELPNLKFLNIWWDSDENAKGNSHLANEVECLKYSDFIIENCTPSRLDKMRKQLPPYQDHINTDKVHFHPTIFDCKIFHPRDLEKKYDIAIAGSPVGNRREWVKFLSQQYPDQFIHFGGLNLGGSPLPMTEYAQKLCQTKILVNTQSYSFMPQCKGKVREALLSKAFLLEEDNKETRHYVPEGKGVIFFKGEEDLKDKIDYYLTHDTERNAIAQQGYDWIMKNYAPEKWTKQIFDTILPQERST